MRVRVRQGAGCGGGIHATWRSCDTQGAFAVRHSTRRRGGYHLWRALRRLAARGELRAQARGLAGVAKGTRAGGAPCSCLVLDTGNGWRPCCLLLLGTGGAVPCHTQQACHSISGAGRRVVLGGNRLAVSRHPGLPNTWPRRRSNTKHVDTSKRPHNTRWRHNTNGSARDKPDPAFYTAGQGAKGWGWGVGVGAWGRGWRAAAAVWRKC